mmetsp:Transcript_39001/g.112610  ORF Transcript_39001/g.112610 Transcript_39001/m.112610 type:complete len:445 (-) Transcript_39001:37-1371(-)
MVCASGLAPAMPISQKAWKSWTEYSDRSAEECYATAETEAHLMPDQASQLANTMHPFQPTASSHTVHGLVAAPMQVCHMHMIVCQAFRQQQDQPSAWPACQYLANEFQADRRVQVEPRAPFAPEGQHDQMQKMMLSASARRRLRRRRAAERTSEAKAPPSRQSELHSPFSDTTDGISCTKLLEAIEAGGAARSAALDGLRGSMVQLTFDRQGCRLVQAAVQGADPRVAAELLAELRGHVRDALASPHANYVIQTIITALPTAMSSFIVKELLGVGTRSARHRFGCRILCRLIEHSGASGDLDKLLGEVLAEAEGLCSHAFGHFVIESLLEHLPQHRQTVVQALLADLPGYACHRCGSHVVESALLHCSEADRRELVSELLSGDTVVSLAQHQYGSFVLKALLQTPGKASEQALAQISGAAAILAGTRCGQRLLQDLGISAVAAP